MSEPNATPEEHARITREIAATLPEGSPRRLVMEMAARLRIVVGGYSGDAALDRIASECIRQMQWAAKEGTFDSEPTPPMMTPGIYPGHTGGGMKFTPKPLTMAPDDWSPTEPRALSDLLARLMKPR